MTAELSSVTTDKDIVPYSHFINGAYVEPVGGEWIDSIDPYRNEVWARVPAAVRRTSTMRLQPHKPR